MGKGEMIRNFLIRIFDMCLPKANPMLMHPGYLALHKDIQERRRKHLPVRDLLEQKRQLVHRALAQGGRR